MVYRKYTIRRKKRTFWGEVLSWSASVAAAFAIALFVNTAIIVNAEVPTDSMTDTIQVGDRIVGYRLAYAFFQPERGDVVLFPFPDDEKQQFVKRIIGLPGETVEIVGGKVYIDGSRTPLDEPYLPEEPVGDYGPYQVPGDSYFMMGDNRNGSLDSRFWEHPYVERGKIRAKAEFCYYPRPYRLA